MLYTYILDVLCKGTPANIRMYLTFLETRVIGLHFATGSLCLPSFTFFLVGSESYMYCISARVTFLSLKVIQGY